MKPLNLLIVDNHLHDLQETVRVLSKIENLQICNTASSGYEAIAKASVLHPQVVVMEMDMETPQAGLLALHEINSTLKDIAVCFYSNKVEDEIVQKAYAGGAVNYLFKYASPRLLMQAVTTAALKGNPISADTAAILLADYRKIKKIQDNLSSILKPVFQLTETEMNILRLMDHGLHPREIERIRFIEHSTMKTHISHIIRKFNTESITQVLDMLHESCIFDLFDEERK